MACPWPYYAIPTPPTPFFCTVASGHAAALACEHSLSARPASFWLFLHAPPLCPSQSRARNHTPLIPLIQPRPFAWPAGGRPPLAWPRLCLFPLLPPPTPTLPNLSPSPTPTNAHKCPQVPNPVAMPTHSLRTYSTHTHTLIHTLCKPPTRRLLFPPAPVSAREPSPLLNHHHHHHHSICYSSRLSSARACCLRNLVMPWLP